MSTQLPTTYVEITYTEDFSGESEKGPWSGRKIEGFYVSPTSRRSLSWVEFRSKKTGEFRNSLESGKKYSLVVSLSIFNGKPQADISYKEIV